MPLIKSISGIRGTIGGKAGEDLTASDVVSFASAFGLYIKLLFPQNKVRIVIGRDARPSGQMIRDLIKGSLSSLGIDIIDLGLAATPTVELAVVHHKAHGGIIITASHNPQGWNALKLLGPDGVFLDKKQGEAVLSIAAQGYSGAVSEDELGSVTIDSEADDRHIKRILGLKPILKDKITARDFKVVVDGINSVGATVIPELLAALGVERVTTINSEADGCFAHKPEPLAENLTDIMAAVKHEGADLGIVVDPDVDRLAFIDEKGEMFGEEYTLVAIADYLFSHFEEGEYNKVAVSNLSSSRALNDIARKYNGTYEAAAVGEINVVEVMRKNKAYIGGEGNGGVIYPALHEGRDALVGCALFLSALAENGLSASEYRKSLPEYFMVKDRIDLREGVDLKGILESLKERFASEKLTTIDGVKIDWQDSWVHLRGSNTEPIIRVYAEARTSVEAEEKVRLIKDNILAYIQ